MSTPVAQKDPMVEAIQLWEQDYLLLKDPYARVDAINKFCLDYTDTMEYTNLAEEKALECKKILETIDYPKGKAFNGFTFAFLAWARAEVEKSIAYCQQALIISREAGDVEMEALCLQFTGVNNVARGDYDSAFRDLFHVLPLLELLPPSAAKTWSYFGIGILYFETKDYVAAEKYYGIAREIALTLDFDYALARIKVAFAGLETVKGNFTKAEELIREGIGLFRKTGHKIGLSRSLNDLGVLCRKIKKYEDAEKYLREGFEIRHKLAHIQGIITSGYELGDLLTETGQLTEAIELLTKALENALAANARQKVYAIHKALSAAYHKSGNNERAYYHLDQFISLQTAVIGQETAQKLKQMETRFTKEKADKETEIERLKNVELKKAHDLIATKNKDILDSIHYAKRLQEAILPSLSSVRAYFPESFILYQPKDIVAGDFYWMEQQGDSLWIAAADCTGHGVPGSIVSFVCSNALNRAFKEFGRTEPGEILDKAREIVVQTFEKSENTVQDGMDISLCRINYKTGDVSWAGANNPLVYVKQGTVYEIKPTKQAVGWSEGVKTFTTHTLQLDKGDCIYLLSDGYADQFGGPAGKKFKFKPLKALIQSLLSFSMEQQAELLCDRFSKWKDDMEQVDDVLVIGIRL